MKYKEIKGDLIQLALEGSFDCIAHGVNCFSKQKNGIAKEMVKEFGTDQFRDEKSYLKGYESLKLGNIDWQLKWIFPKKSSLSIINAYTQYEYGTDKVNLDYEALTLCMRKINRVFKGMRIGLPKIGCGLAGGDWSKVKDIIQRELKDMDVTIVIYEK